MFCPKVCAAILTIWREMLKSYIFPMMESLNKFTGVTRWGYEVIDKLWSYDMYEVMISDNFEISVNIIII